jgi:hypothetical protein
MRLKPAIATDWYNMNGGEEFDGRRLVTQKIGDARIELYVDENKVPKIIHSPIEEKTNSDEYR